MDTESCLVEIIIWIWWMHFYRSIQPTTTITINLCHHINSSPLLSAAGDNGSERGDNANIPEDTLIPRATIFKSFSIYFLYLNIPIKLLLPRNNFYYLSNCFSILLYEKINLSFSKLARKPRIITRKRNSGSCLSIKWEVLNVKVYLIHHISMGNRSIYEFEVKQ